MIHYVVTRANANTLQTYHETWGRDQVFRLRPIYYEDLRQFRKLPAGTYLFTDLERLPPAYLALAEAVWQTLRSTGRCTLLNQPSRVLRRFDLLKELHRQGKNQFTAYRTDELSADVRYPVFVRRECEHDGALSGRLNDWAALDAELTRLASQGTGVDGLLVVEFCDTVDTSGLFRKYSALRVGDRMLPRHLLVSDQWVLKYPDRVTPNVLDEEARFLAEHPHAEPLQAIFDTARIDFGRIDYSVKDGAIQTWEINTNPTLVVPPADLAIGRLPGQAEFAVKLREAFDAIDSPNSDADEVPLMIDPALRRAAGATPMLRVRRRVGHLLHRWGNRAGRGV